ncbi:CIC11C00000000067 [Sungouiella intermedia]|uniref:t-SNARE affecting a late Golgi compartment protein 1 n=1 Tax=Sungouiella intermedia TaxID=45354 RepID=A0A1L0CYH9_9ASCO|nr:CIC11C00000000067 [[Candida] intermedia]
MDPFKEVEEDCWAQINSLTDFINSTSVISEDAKLDFANNYQELEETLEDLRQAVKILESNPVQFNLTSSDIVYRKQTLKQLLQKINLLQSDWEAKEKHPHRQREVTTMSNRISQDGGNPFSETNRIDLEFNQFQQQELIQSQDLQLDQIHQTMQSLNQQATLMGGELEDQGYMLDELDHEMDTVGNKLQRGLKRVNYVIEKNRETASNWCIGILMVVLCILLLVLLIA